MLMAAVPMQKKNYEPNHVDGELLCVLGQGLLQWHLMKMMFSVSLTASVTSSITSAGCTCLDVPISYRSRHSTTSTLTTVVSSWIRFGFWKKYSPGLEIGQDLVWSAELFELEVYSWILRVMHLHTGLVATKVEETFVRLLLVRLCLLCEKFKTLFLVEESGPVVLTALSSIAKVFILALYFGLRDHFWARCWVSRERFQVGSLWNWTCLVWTWFLEEKCSTYEKSEIYSMFKIICKEL